MLKVVVVNMHVFSVVADLFLVLAFLNVHKYEEHYLWAFAQNSVSLVSALTSSTHILFDLLKFTTVMIHLIFLV